MINLRLAHRGAILIAVPFVLLFGILSVLTMLLIKTEVEVRQSERSQAILTQANILSRSFLEAGLDLSAYKTSGTNTFKDQYRRHITEIAVVLQKLKNLVGNNKSEQEELQRCESDITSGLAILSKMSESLPDKGASLFSTRHQFSDLQSISESLHRHLTELVTPEQVIANQSSALQDGSHKAIKNWIVLGIIGSLIMSLALGYFFSTGIIRRVKVIADNSKRLAESEALLPLIDGADEIAQLDKVFHEMATSLNLASEKERALVENAADIICSITKTGEFERVNAATLAIVGYEPNELTGRNYKMIVAEENAATTEQAIEKSIANKSRFAHETQLRRKDGSTLDVIWSSLWSVDNESLFCVIHDISERKKLERLKDEIVQMVAHDLRSPLAALRSFLQLLEQGAYGSLTEHGRSRASTADRSIQQLIRLLNDLLSLDQLKEAKSEIILADHALLPVIERSVELVRNLAEARNIQIMLPSKDAVAVCDSDRIIQVLANLLSNAIKFSPDGGSITIEISHTANDTIEISVADCGAGIPASEHDAIFDRFKQAKSSNKKEGGLGLGLAIAKAIIEQHGGTIGVISAQDEGSKFWFRLPEGTSPIESSVESAIAPAHDHY